MIAKIALIVTAAAVISGALVVPSLAGGDDKGDRLEKGGAVVPCSLDGVNPAYHPDIFAHPAAARNYGFVRTADGTWHVAPGCGAPGFAASAYAPRPEHKKAIRPSQR